LYTVLISSSHLVMGAAVARGEQAAEDGKQQRSDAGDGRTVKFEDEDDEEEDQRKARDRLVAQNLR
jgi:hypothetical protein